MKQAMTLLCFFIICCIFNSSCSTYIPDSHSFGTQVRPTTNLTQAQVSDEILPDTSWDELFRNSADALISGQGLSMQIKIPRLSDSYLNEPLFVVNDRTIGKGFVVISHIDPNSVAKIRILRRPNEISLYGNQGRHGVILIKTI